jgi:glycosyltransferase involved in cell wall biosynthesis
LALPLITVIVPVFNAARYVSQALESLLAQTYPDFRIVVVDDASTDDTAAVLRRFRDPRLFLLTNRQRLGPAEARNRGLEEAASKYVAFHDGDDIAHANRLETQLGFLAAQPDVRLVAARIRVIDHAARPTGAMWGEACKGDELVCSMLFRNGLATSTIMVERELIGGERFDHSLAVASDYDMWLRLLDRGVGACLPDVLVSYRDHELNYSHARRHAADACLDRILRARLRRLHIEASQDELRVHRALGSGCAEGTAIFLAAADAWLRRLHRANERTKVLPRAAFGRVLDRRWLHACEAAASGGCWQAVPLSIAAPFAPGLAGANLPRLLRLPWRTARGYVRRRWPRVGAGARSAMRATRIAPLR